MDKKSKILLTIICIGIFLSVGVVFYRTVMQNNFEIIDYVPE